MQTDLISQEDKIKGSLFGLVWGDVLGCPIEGWKKQKIHQHFCDADLEKLYDFPSKDFDWELKVPSLGFSVAKKCRYLGVYSDDSQQCLALINCCIQENTSNFLPENWVKWMIAGKEKKAWRGFGKNWAKSISNLQKRCSPKKSASISSGIGAAMKIGPIGAVYRNHNETELGEAVYKCCLISHGSIMSSSLAYAIAFCVYSLVNGKSCSEVISLLPNAVSAQEKYWLLNEPEWNINRENYHFISGIFNQLLII